MKAGNGSEPIGPGNVVPQKIVTFKSYSMRSIGLPVKIEH